MAHKISITDDGTAEAFYAEKPAWHGLGQVVENALSSSGAIKMAHLDWQVNQSPVYFQSENGVSFIKSKKHVANYRADTNDILGVVTNRYKIVQNLESFDFMDSLLDTGNVVYESAGALKGGKIIWILARIPGDMQIGDSGDVSRKYMLLYNSHDGTKSVRVRPTSVRVVCWNTLSAAIRGNDNEIAISHKGNIKTKVRDAQNVLKIANAGFDTLHEKCQILSEKRITTGDFKDFLSVIEPEKKNPNENDMKNLYRRRDKISGYFDAECKTAEKFNMPVTAYTAVNAFTAYNTHGRKGRKTPERGFEATFIGTGAKDSNWALNKAMAVFV